MAPEPALAAHLRVLLDCTAIPAHRGGVGRYIEGLLAGLPADRVELSLVVQQRDFKAFSEQAPDASIHSLPSALRIRALRLLWEQLRLPSLARRLSIDVLHSPHYTYPRAWRGGRVVTLHDATFFSDPQVHRLIKRWFFRFWTRRSWKHADAVITPSAATGTELRRFLGESGAPVVVAYLGVDHQRFHPPTPDELAAFRRSTAALESSSWISFLGTIEPRKNVVALLDAYELLRADLGAATPDLLISGDRGWDAAAASRLDALAPRSGVRELGYVPMSNLSALLGGADAVIYPSVGEGFGLPVLEALASGAVVITTRRLAIPEVAGNAVIYVEPTAEGIHRALREVLLDPAAKEHLREVGLQRAQGFTWQSTATSHVIAYEHAAHSRVAA